MTPKILNFSGALLVDRAAALKAELSEALEGSSQVLVSLSLIEDLDLACLQVFYAARRTAVKSGKEFHFIGTVPSRIVKRLAAAGFLSGSPERAEDFEAGLIEF
jgi:anti-anti-sigma regulatory factor